MCFKHVGTIVKREQAVLQISDSQAVSDLFPPIHILKRNIFCFNNTEELRLTETPGVDFNTTLLAQGMVQIPSG